MEPNLVIAQDSTYQAAALRLEPNQGAIQVLRGVSGEVVGNIGVFRGTNLASLVERSPEAVAEAKQFRRDYAPGIVMISLGLAAMGAAIGVGQINDVNRMIPTGLTVGSLLLLGYGSIRLQSAYRALSKSIWLYNREFAN
jgi:hypothetical protein